jgi:hypothetical protein
MGLFTARSHLRHADLATPRSAALATAAASPRSAKALADAGGLLIDEGLRARNLESIRVGLELTQRSVEIYPNLPWVWLNLGKAQLTLQRFDEAAISLAEVIERAEPGTRLHTEAQNLLHRVQGL